jgi:pyruvate/2-oxoglutarate dehydrogenase complex dihydrolipoamide acyltransferase (E2) component
MVEFRLPDIGEGLSEAELLEWTVKVGDRVSEGDEVAMVSTDKVNVDLTSPASGLVIELLGKPGDVINVGTVIMRIDDGSGIQTGTPADAVVSPAASGPSIKPTVTTVTASAGGEIKAAPVTRRYAADRDVDLALVTGTGPGGQVLRSDVDAYLAAGEGLDDEASGIERIRLSGPRLAAAQRLAQAADSQVTTTITFEVRADGLLDALQKLEREKDQDQPRLTPVALVAHALVKTLRQHPNFNATVSGDGRELMVHDSINLGLAVDTPNGLMVPVIKDAGSRAIAEIAAEVSRLARRARDGDLALNDVKGSTFTLSSTGGLEQAAITGTTPIINYPDVATLWVSKITDRPRVADGDLEVGPMMSGSLSFDHRFLHGADGMAFVNSFETAVAYS